MTPANLFDHLGRPFRLGPQLPDGKGGEGTVFEVVTSPDLVAKIYHKPPSPQTAAKLRAMVRLAREELTRVAAWPTATLHERPGGPVVGLAMRRIIDSKEIHTLYSPAHRKTAFPQADWRFLVVTAANCAAALENLHQCGVVMGDVNEKNELVSPTGLVTLIDCDAFQFQMNGQQYLCEVGVPLFTPPELQTQNFRGVVRSPNHDRFGLAVLIFHLLFMGRHPFSGRFQGRGEMPIEKAIGEYRFAYGGAARRYEMQPPLHTLPLSAISVRLVDLFERAFGARSSQGSARPTGAEWHRELTDFAKSLRACPTDPGHFYATHLPSCPWCELMKQGAPNFFISVSFFKAGAAATGPPFVLAAVWARIDQVPRPNPTYQPPPWPVALRATPFPPGVPTAAPAKPAPPSILVTPPPPPSAAVQPPSRPRIDIRANATQWTVGAVAVAAGLGFGPLALCVKPVAVACLIAFVLFGTWWGVLEGKRRSAMYEANREYKAKVAVLQEAARRRRREWDEWLACEQAKAQKLYAERLRPWQQAVAAIQEEASRRRRVKMELERQLATAESAWSAVSSRCVAAFDTKKEALRKLRQRHEELAREYAIDRQRLEARARDIQLEQFLSQHFISDGDIPDIGKTRTATLASFGIETAWDVDADTILEVPNFGPKLTERLVHWRKTIEARFVFDPRVGVPDHEKRTLDMKYAQARQQVETRLGAGEGELRGIAREAEKELRAQYDRIGETLKLLAQAHLDLTLIPQGF